MNAEHNERGNDANTGSPLAKPFRVSSDVAVAKINRSSAIMAAVITGVVTLVCGVISAIVTYNVGVQHGAQLPNIVTVVPSFPNEGAVLDKSAVQDGVTNILKNDYKLNVTSVSCPANEDVKVGNTFSCRATIDGQQKQVHVTVKTSDGQYEVTQPS